MKLLPLFAGGWICVLGAAFPFCTSSAGEEVSRSPLRGNPDLPLAAQNILKAEPDAWFFVLPGENEFDLERIRSHEKYRRMLHSLIDMRMKTGTELTKLEKRNLIKILLYPQNYLDSAGLNFDFIDAPHVGCIFKAKNGAVDICFGSYFVWLYQDAGWTSRFFSDGGAAAFKRWLGKQEKQP